MGAQASSTEMLPMTKMPVWKIRSFSEDSGVESLSLRRGGASSSFFIARFSVRVAGAAAQD